VLCILHVEKFALSNRKDDHVQQARGGPPCDPSLGTKISWMSFAYTRIYSNIYQQHSHAHLLTVLLSHALSVSNTSAHTHTHSHTHTQTNLCTHIRTCTYTHTKTHKHTYTHKHTHVHTHTFSPVHVLPVRKTCNISVVVICREWRGGMAPRAWRRFYGSS